MEPSFRPRVHWSEGMFLHPQHFQQRDQHLDELRTFYASARHPYPHGLISWDWDADALSTGTLRLTKLTGILPDGSALHHADFLEAVEYKIQDEEMVRRLQEEGAVLPVYLGLSNDTRRTTGGREPGLFRYGVVHPEPVPDLNSGENPREVACLKLTPKLILEEDKLLYYSSVKIGEVFFKLDNYHLTEWIPSTLRIRQGHPLHDMAQELAKSLRSKAGEIISQFDSARSEGATSKTLESRFQVRSVLHGVPALETFLETSCAHPVELYKTYLEIITQLAVVTPGVDLPRFPTYQHDNPKATFTALTALIANLLDQVCPTRFQSTPLEWKEDSFVGPFLPAWDGKTIYLVARRSPDDDGEMLRTWIEKSFIARQDKIDWCRNAVYPGAQRMLIPDPPPEITPGRGHLIFKLEDDPRTTLTGDGGLYVTPPAMPNEVTGRPADLRVYVEI